MLPAPTNRAKVIKPSARMSLEVKRYVITSVVPVADVAVEVEFVLSPDCAITMA